MIIKGREHVVASIVTELKKGNETLTKKVSELENIIKEKDEIIKDLKHNRSQREEDLCKRIRELEYKLRCESSKTSKVNTILNGDLEALLKILSN